MATVAPHRSPAAGSTLTLDEAAVLLHVRPPTVQRFIDDGQLDATVSEDGVPLVYFLQTYELRRGRRAIQASALHDFGLMVDEYLNDQPGD